MIRPVQKEEWIWWRNKMGVKGADARQAFREHQSYIGKFVLQKPQGKPKRLHYWPTVQDGSAWDRMIDAMPRKPYAFLAMVARIELERKRTEERTQVKEVRRKKYLKRFQARGKKS